MSKAMTPCGPECEHSDLTHNAFDRGVRDGAAGKDIWDCPYEQDALVQAWFAGQSVGELDRREAEKEKAEKSEALQPSEK